MIMFKIIFPEVDERVLNAISVFSDGFLFYLISNDAKLKSKNVEILRSNNDLSNIEYAATLVKDGFADTFIGGNISETKDVIRVGLKIIGTTKFASSCMILKKNNEVLVFADCAFNLNPTTEQIVEMSKDCAEVALKLKIEPVISLLSYTSNNPKGDVPKKMSDATNILKNSSYLVHGEIQFDAAYNQSTFEKKMKNNNFKKSNIFIFPDIQSANIGYKIAQELGGYNCVGPIMIGFKKRFYDLSRGCKTEDVVELIKLAKILD